MTTITFAPSTRVAFQFAATLDGQGYQVIVPWNIYSQRYYINVYDLSGTLIFGLPLIGSPVGYDISLTAGYFASTMVYRKSVSLIEILP